MNTKKTLLVFLLLFIVFSTHEALAQTQINFDWREDGISLPWPEGKRMLKRIHFFDVSSNKNVKIEGKIKVTNLEKQGTDFASIKLSIQIVKVDANCQSTIIASSTPSPWEMYKTESYFRDVSVNFAVKGSEKIEIWLQYEGGARIDKAGPPHFEVDKESFIKINY